MDRRAILFIVGIGLLAGTVTYATLEVLGSGAPTEAIEPVSDTQHTHTHTPHKDLRPPYLPLRAQLEDLLGPDQELVSVALVANLAGEIEGCSCSGTNLRGGLMQTLHLLEALSSEVPGLVVCDAGGNLTRADGLLSQDDLPATFVASVRGLWAEHRDIARLDRSVHGAHVQIGGAELSLGVVDFEPRGQSIVVLHVLGTALSRDAESAPRRLQNVTLRFRIALVKALAGDGGSTSEADHEIRTLLSAGFLAEAVSVHGDIWRSVSDLAALRNTMLAEWLQARFGEPTSELGTALDPAAMTRCEACHQESFDGYRSHATHADAWNALARQGENATRNPFCVACHTTSLPRIAFHSNPLEVPEAQRGVLCGACHVRAHAGEADATTTCTDTFLRPGVTICATCHTPGRHPIASRLDGPDGVPLSSLVGCAGGAAQRED